MFARLFSYLHNSSHSPATQNERNRRHQHGTQDSSTSTSIPPTIGLSSRFWSSRIRPSKCPGTETQCYLITGLPPEIRRLIWKEVLGGQTIHLETRSRCLSHVICAAADPNTCNDIYGTYGCWVSKSRGLRLPEPPRHLPALLLTCKQIYDEAIDYLYSSNAFVAARHDIIQFLPDLLLPRHMHTIRSLRFTWHNLTAPPPFPDARVDPRKYHIVWNTIWHNLASMEGLRDLHVKLVVTARLWENLSEEKTRDLIAPIMEVTRPKHFILSLPFRENLADGEKVDLWSELPCTIRRAYNSWAFREEDEFEDLP